MGLCHRAVCITVVVPSRLRTTEYSTINNVTTSRQQTNTTNKYSRSTQQKTLQSIVKIPNCAYVPLRRICCSINNATNAIARPWCTSKFLGVTYTRIYYFCLTDRHSGVRLRERDSCLTGYVSVPSHHLVCQREREILSVCVCMRTVCMSLVVHAFIHECMTSKIKIKIYSSCHTVAYFIHCTGCF